MERNVKKNAAGHAEVWMLFVGGSSSESNGSSVRIVGFYIPKTGLSRKYKTGISGLRSGYWSDRPTKP
jgi:hypothetical protein